MKCRKLVGFTLIELLIVVAIIAILAAIAVPNFLESQTRAKIARVKNDLRALTVALEAYRVDYNRYPPSDEPTENFRGETGIRFVTTPIAFIVGENTRDVYVGRVDNSTAVQRTYPYYGYAARDLDNRWATINTPPRNNAHWFIILSKGPNLNTDPFALAIETDNTALFYNVIYDPTNGIISDGNIFRSGGDIRGNGAEAARTVASFADTTY